MNKPIKQKLCWNCEGSVATHIENCPYCGVYLSPDQQEEFNFDLLKPPYPLQSDEADEAVNVPKAPYTPDEIKEEPLFEEKKSYKFLFIPFETILPLVGLTSGVVFALFSLALYLFSDNGILTLQWNADYWYIYALLAAPALCLGWYSLSNIKEEIESH